MRIIHSTVEPADGSVPDVPAHTAAVLAGQVLRESAILPDSNDALGSYARLVEYTDPAGATRYALDWADDANAGCEDSPDPGEAEAAYERHVRELASVGWPWETTDVDGVMDRTAWLEALDAETEQHESALDAMSHACADGTFGGLGLDTNSEAWDDERLVVVARNGWTAHWSETQGWV